MILQYCSFFRDVESNWKWIRFGDVNLRCPGNPETYLDRTYGPDWRDIGATQSYDHIHRESVQQQMFALNQDLYQPAKPFQ